MAEGTRRSGRGWGALIGLALVVMPLWAGGDALTLVCVPIALVMLALPPRRVPQLALALLAMLLAAPALGSTRQALWVMNGLWPAVLAAWFVLAVYVLPRASLTMRALAATGATVATMAVVAVIRPDLLRSADATIAATLKAATAANVATLKTLGVQVTPAAVEAFGRGAAIQSFLTPACAGLASLAALALAWWIYRRTLSAEERPLAPIREFRFRDELVWLVVAGIVLVVTPDLGAGALRVGSNLLTFMGALYALRGVAVLVALAGGGMGPGGIVLTALVAVLIPPLVMAATVLVGLTDTWLDLRARIARTGGPGNDGVIR